MALATRESPGHEVPKVWREEFSSANRASLAIRIAFPIVACVTLMPLVSPGLALLAASL
jgi:hypothetical protein